MSASVVAPGHLPDEDRHPPQRRQLQAVEEARVDVGRELGARGDRREHRPLDEGDGDREVQVGVGREAGDLRRRAQPARVDRQQEEREDERRDDQRGLAQRAAHRAPRRRSRPGGRALRSRRHGLLSAAASPSSPAPSSERPVLARKTSSSDGECSCRCASAIPARVERAHDVGQLLGALARGAPRRPWASARRARRSGASTSRRARGRAGRRGSPRPCRRRSRA